MSLAVKRGTGSGKLDRELEIDVFVNRNGVVTNAQLVPTEIRVDIDMLSGEPPLDSLIATSNIFGFCGGSHQLAAANTLEHIWNAKVPKNALLIRSIAQASELLQHTCRWFYGTFAPDLTNPAFANIEPFEEVNKRFTKHKGTSFWNGMKGATIPMAIYALFGGHWPHGEFIVPGGVSTEIDQEKIQTAKQLIEKFKKDWLEASLLNDTVANYQQIQTLEALQTWVENKQPEELGDFALFLRSAIAFGLDKIGEGQNRFITYGAFNVGETDFQVNPINHIKGATIPAGFLNKKTFQSIKLDPFIEANSFFSIPDLNYNDKVVELGSLARMLMLGQKEKNPAYHLVMDIYQKEQASVFLRGLARLQEAFVLTEKITSWLDQIDLKEPFRFEVEERDGFGVGITESPKGGLLHLGEIKDGKIKNYRVISPNLINVFTKNGVTKSSALAVNLTGTLIKDLNNPIEIGLICRSMDASQTCKVNFLKNRSGKLLSSVKV